MANIRKNKTLSLQHKKRKFPNSNIYRVIHEKGIFEFLFAATHYTHYNHSHLYLQAVKLKLATPLSRLQVGLRARPLKATYLVNSFFGR
jgi:hypothetical protein